MKKIIALCIVGFFAVQSTGETVRAFDSEHNPCLNDGIGKIAHRIEERSARKPINYEVTTISQSKNQRTIKLTFYFETPGNSWLTAKVKLNTSNCCTSQWSITARSGNLSSAFSENQKFKFSCNDNYGNNRKIRPGRPYPRGNSQRRGH